MLIAIPFVSAGSLTVLCAGIIGAIAAFVTKSEPVSDDWQTRYRALETKVRRKANRWSR